MKELRLLQKGKRGLLRVVFSRTGLVAGLLLMNVFLLFSIHKWFRGLIPPAVFPVLALIFITVMAIYLLNSDMDPTSKITWLALIAVVPTVGALLYFYTQADIGHRMLKRRVEELLAQSKSALTQRKSSLEALEQMNEHECSLANYLKKSGNHPVYDQCRLKYFASGEEKFEELKQQLSQAKRFIFMEYFIIEEGKMWGEVLEILAKKARQGVDVRIMYDGSCEFATLPRDYPQRLKALGIQCKVFSPATPLVSTHYNYRDHRKIAVIDGQIAFTGGVNLADEYINEIEKHGRWKDAALMVQGVLAAKENMAVSEKVETIQAAICLFDGVCADGNYGEHNRLIARMYTQLSLYLWLDGKQDGAFQALDRSLAHFKQFEGLCQKEDPT